jgi:hypothetical protein
MTAGPDEALGAQTGKELKRYQADVGMVSPSSTAAVASLADTQPHRTT